MMLYMSVKIVHTILQKFTFLIKEAKLQEKKAFEATTLFYNIIKLIGFKEKFPFVLRQLR